MAVASPMTCSRTSLNRSSPPRVSAQALAWGLDMVYRIVTQHGGSIDGGNRGPAILASLCGCRWHLQDEKDRRLGGS